MIDHAKALALIGSFEGRVPWMYLDTNGYVTVGIGNLLATPQTALALVWYHNALHDDAGQEAGPTEISDEWARVHAAVPGRVASSYRAITMLELADAETDRLFGKRVDEFEVQLVGEFPDFPTWPEPAQLGALDMIFNCGLGELKRDFPHYMQALHDGDFAGAAEHCHRKSKRGGDERNEAVRKLFEAAAAG